MIVFNSKLRKMNKILKKLEKKYPQKNEEFGDLPLSDLRYIREQCITVITSAHEVYMDRYKTHYAPPRMSVSYTHLTLPTTPYV